MQRALALAALLLGGLAEPAALAAAPATAPPVANIRRIFRQPAPPGERLELVLDRAVEPEMASVEPARLVFELDATRPGYGVHGRVFDGGLVAELRLAAVGVPSRPRTQVEIVLRTASAHRLRVQGNHVVLELVPAGLELPLEVPPAPSAPIPAPQPPAPPRLQATTVPRIEPEPGGAAPLAGLSPAPVPPTTARLKALPAVEPEPVAPLEALAATARVENLEPAAGEAAVPRLRALPSVTPVSIEPLELAPVVPVIPSLESAPGGDRGQLHQLPSVVPRPVPPLEASAPAPPAQIAAAERQAAALRIVASEPPRAPQTPLAVTPAVPETATSPGVSGIVLPDERARADELVPPAEIPRPAAPPASAGSATRVVAVEWVATGVVRIVADGVLAFLSFRLENPERFVLELDGVADASPNASLRANEPVLVGVRIAQFRRAPRPVTRVIFDLRTPSIPEIESTSTGLVVRFVRAVPRLAGPPTLLR